MLLRGYYFLRRLCYFDLYGNRSRSEDGRCTIVGSVSRHSIRNAAFDRGTNKAHICQLNFLARWIRDNSEVAHGRKYVLEIASVGGISKDRSYLLSGASSTVRKHIEYFNLLGGVKKASDGSVMFNIIDGGFHVFSHQVSLAQLV
jgi:hypothetical protein